MSTKEKIIEDFCTAWQTLNADLIIRHLSNDFVYDSQWVFESLRYFGYTNYIQGKFQTLKEKGIQIEASVVDDPYFGGKILKLNQNGTVRYYRIEVTDGKVVKGDMCMF